MKFVYGSVEFPFFVCLYSTPCPPVLCVDTTASQMKLSNRVVHRPTSTITRVALVVVVDEEIQPVLNSYNPVLSQDLTEEFLRLATVFVARIPQERSGISRESEYTLYILKVGESELYHRHNSGYSQSAAVVALAVKILSPHLIVSFGTGGGIIKHDIAVGDVILASGTVFLDRFRLSSKNAFDWGVFGGTTMPCKRIWSDLGLKQGLLGSQISYNIGSEQEELIRILNVACLDMEGAPEAQICDCTRTNFIAMKVISNGVYPSDSKRMEQEYIANKLRVSTKAVEVLSSFLEYLVGKQLQDL
eukprot:TRINITY_DN3824_c0_g1_i4.p1 TRINITY_DN3824_c0_g1~~TRINITY_DN3824_c0_g1_i4.p1  ORF type:complete len:303 (-),score=56.10 TRINITY_DN3824_c0_g1_i4:104-1012(-)